MLRKMFSPTPQAAPFPATVYASRLITAWAASSQNSVLRRSALNGNASRPAFGLFLCASLGHGYLKVGWVVQAVYATQKPYPNDSALRTLEPVCNWQ